MKSDNHDKSHYWDYIKDMKFLLDSHVPKLQGQEPKDVVKMIKTTIQDPECKYLCPSESTEASSTNEDMHQKFDTPSEADIMAEFPQDMLTPEVRLNISNALEHIEVSHTEAAEVIWGFEKAHHHHTGWCILFSVTSDGATPYHNSMLTTLPHQIRWRIAAILHYHLKNETGIKIAIMATSKLLAPRRNCSVKHWREFIMSPVCRKTDERMQLMISRSIPPPVRKSMIKMMMMMKKVLLPE